MDFPLDELFDKKEKPKADVMPCDKKTRIKPQQLEYSHH
jgi:hypothetical protein